MNTNNIIELRHQLHQNPELSNQEFTTSERISQFMQSLQPDAEIRLGATGKLFVFEGKKTGATLMFRAELDALPIAEETNVAYVSLHKNTSHACGHDGHMAIIAGLAIWP